MFFYTRYRRELGAACRRVQSSGSSITETRLGAIEQVTFGEGPPVLLVHGVVGGADQGRGLAGAYFGDGFKVVAAIRRPDVLLHGFLGLSLVEGEIAKGFDVGLVLVRAGHGSLLKLLKWSTTEEELQKSIRTASERRTQKLDEIPVALLESEARRSSEI